ncbi:STAS domain-containing protein [Prolixibacteraceae bacterium JC049]|nr:STAS domain-containing protein [Prolixibacteraceae bacterium JC049]
MNLLFQPKLFSILKSGYTKQQLISDTLAGIVVGIVALPLAIAFAVASGVSPEKGIITAIVAGFLISLLGGSRVQIGGPTGAYIVILFAIIQQYGLNGLLISTIMAGFMLIAFGLLRLGSLLKFFPQPLVTGFTSGIALVIFATQIKDALGLSVDKVPADFISKFGSYASNIHSTNITTLVITVATILITIYWSKISKRIPGSFVAILIMTVAVQLFHLPVSSIETFFGDIPSTISLSMPQFQWSELHNYIQPAITIALLGSIESLLSAVVADGMISGNHRSNTELIAQGVANIVTPFFGGIPATGAIARTATNVKNGGRTPVAGMMHAITLLVIMLFAGQWAKLIPMSCLAGILIVVAYNMSEWRSFVAIFRSSFFDIIVLLTTFLLTVLVDLTIAIEVGVVLSALLFMKRMADLKPEAAPCVDSDVIEDYSAIPKGIGIYEVSGPFFFASAKQYSEVLTTIGLKHKAMIIRMRHVPFIDATGMQNLQSVLKTLQHRKIQVIISGVNPQVKEDLIKTGIDQKFIFDRFESALNTTKSQLG